MKDVQYGGPWQGQKVFWYVARSYRGRVLIRGRRIDGTTFSRVVVFTIDLAPA